MTATRNVFEGINFRCNPYRGILRDIAKSEGVTVAAIRQACFFYNNPRIIALVTEKLKEAQSAEKEAKRVTKKVMKAAA